MSTILLFTLFAQAQKFDGYVVTNTNDTIHCKYYIGTHSSDEKIPYPSTVCKKVKILTNKGEEMAFKPSQLKSFFIKGTKDCDLKFVSLKEDDDQFYHELITGKLSLYKIYFTSYGNEFSNGVILKDEKLYKIAGFGTRKKFGELIKDYPELYNKWMNSEDYKLNQFQELVSLYNEHFKN
ncbi:hypothetical protein ACSVH2_03530 [Flavobacterium sp. RSB2_4_14]|uniref:hypothetical protein n=1 Tax=Flavobacterium sp. RSB2_4_14 TaxID=3447665 RepID=UPI003F2C6714